MLNDSYIRTNLVQGSDQTRVNFEQKKFCQLPTERSKDAKDNQL